MDKVEVKRRFTLIVPSGADVEKKPNVSNHPKGQRKGN